ncbi:hypothetical protein [Armatimonas rosea]|uniref:Nucleotidyltransferase n=1 Tax=Armatimonas rosea TaxID=685828 RepID=A0A7W9SW74_ARMRO|nr:hypothetical protein [Armatimonas rosea]MBB6053113.1 hypothetical protein [Armatimonas rosea]
MVFHVFGSPSSVDCDIVVFVDALPTLEDSKALAAQLAPELAAQLGTDKKLNVNFAVLHEGVITETLKGLPDETNNAALATYGFHPQPHPLAIARPVPRDLDAKRQRAARIVLSLYSRTPQREAVKRALSGDFVQRCAMLEVLDLAEPVDFGKNGTPEDIAKSIAFQLGQAVALSEGVELYTKEALAAHFPALAPALRREPLTPPDRQALEQLKRRFLSADCPS